MELKFMVPYTRSPKVGNPIASILKSHVYRIPALIVLNPVSSFFGFTILVHGWDRIEIFKCLFLFGFK